MATVRFELLPNRMKQLSALFGRDASAITRDVARTGAHAMIDATPVDKGDLVSSYSTGIDERPETPGRKAYVPGDSGSTAAANRVIARQNATLSIARFSAERNRLISVVNNTPYSGIRNSVSSQPFFLQKGAAAAIGRVNRIGRILGYSERPRSR